MGETHMRLAMEKEAIYASSFPFLEYGQDLDIMSEMEKGVRSSRLTRTDYDTNPPNKKEQKYLNEYLDKMHCRKSDRIPEKLYKDGPDAYLV